MYETHYRLQVDPFRLTPDLRFRFEHRSFLGAQAYVDEMLDRAAPLAAISGRPGTGKTTLVEFLAAGIDRRRYQLLRLVSPRLDPPGLLSAIAQRMGHSLDYTTVSAAIRELTAGLTRDETAPRRLLVIDEAQNIPPASLDLLGQLCEWSAELPQRPLQCLLIGQPELRDLLTNCEQPVCRDALKHSFELEHLSATETRDYVAYRLECSGWQGTPRFEGEAIRLIHHFGLGIPRHINKLCSRLLLHGAIEEREVIGPAEVEAVMNELRDERLYPWTREQHPEPRREATRMASGPAPADITLAPGPNREPEPVPELDTPMSADEPVTDLPAGLSPATAPEVELSDEDGEMLPHVHPVPESVSPAPALEATHPARPNAHLAWSAAVAGLATVGLIALLALLAWSAPGFWQDREQRMARFSKPAGIDTRRQSDRAPSQPQATTSANGDARSVPPATETAGGADPARPDETDYRAIELVAEEGAETEDAADIASFQPAPAVESTAGGAAQARQEILTSEQDLAVGISSQSVAETAAAEGPPVDVEALYVRGLLDAARQAYEDYRLTVPGKDNAYALYREVLELDPGNAQAQAGIDAIGERYRWLAERAIASGKLNRAQTLALRGLRVRPQDPHLRELSRRIRSMIQQQTMASSLVPADEQALIIDLASDGLVKTTSAQLVKGFRALFEPQTPSAGATAQASVEE